MKSDFMTRIIGIISGKGGVGKTIVSINLAAALHRWFGKKVLLVDCNVSTSHIGLYLGLYSTPITLNDVLRGTVTAEKAIYEHQSGIKVMPASLKLADMKDIEWENFKERLKEIFEGYDFVILDSSPGFGKESMLTLGTCSEAIFVTNPIIHSAVDLVKCKELSKELGINSLGIVLNMVRNRKYELSIKEVRELVELNVISSIPYDEKITKSIVSKQAFVSDGNSKAHREFKRLAQIVSGEHYLEEESGFFRKFFGFLKS